MTTVATNAARVQARARQDRSRRRKVGAATDRRTGVPPRGRIASGSDDLAGRLLPAVDREDEPVAKASAWSPAQGDPCIGSSTAGSVPPSTPPLPVEPAWNVRLDDPAEADPRVVRARLLLDPPRFKSPESLWVRDDGSVVKDERRNYRHPGIILSDQERATLRQGLERAKACGSYWCAFRKVDLLGERGPEELRMLARIPCGLRMCDRCLDVSLKRKRFRLEGEWNIIGLLTFAQENWTRRHRWTWASHYATEFFKRFRRRYKHIAKALGIKLEYAWVIEPHQSGWPHIHWVSNLPWEHFSRQWHIEEWQDLVGSDSTMVGEEPVLDVSACRRYLCKYLSKAHLTFDILTIIKRKRLFATTMKLPKQQAAGWVAYARLDQGEAEVACEGEDRSDWRSRFTRVWSNKKTGSLWARPYQPGRVLPDIEPGNVRVIKLSAREQWSAVVGLPVHDVIEVAKQLPCHGPPKS